jgi:hypothetical protein
MFSRGFNQQNDDFTIFFVVGKPFGEVALKQSLWWSCSSVFEGQPR